MGREKSVAPNVRNYNTRLRGMFSEKKAHEAVELVDKMLHGGIAADAFTYDALIQGFCGNRDLEEALKRYGDLRKKKLSPNFVGRYLTLVPACCEASHLDKAIELCSDAVGLKLSLNMAVFKGVNDGLNKKGRTTNDAKLESLMNRAE